MKRIIISTLLISGFMFFLNSCSKEKTGGLNAVFSYVADGYKTNFTNFSSGATTYFWDFGDGDTSNMRSPVHIFKGKGDFLVTLKAFNGEQESSFTDTVKIFGPNIKIDGDFSDWDYVDYTAQNEGTSSITGVKTVAGQRYLYFLIEGTENMALDIIDIYLDTDNNPATGFATWMYPAGSGAEFLFEGSISGRWGDLFKHAGAPGDWNWSAIGGYDDILFASEIKVRNGKKVIELSIQTDKFGSLKGAVNFAILESTSGWAEIGNIPASQQPTSGFGKIAL